MADIQLIRGSNGNGPAARPVVTAARSSGSLTIKVNSTTNLPTRFIGTWGKLNQETGKLVSSTIRDFYGQLNGSDIDLVRMADGFTDDGNEIGDVIVLKPNTDWTHNLADVIQKQADDIQGTVTARDELLADSIVSGTGLVTVTSGRTIAISNMTYYMNGIRLTKTGIPNKTLTATKDTYGYINAAGDVSYVEVAVGATPTAPANSIPFVQLTTNATAVTSTLLMSRSSIRYEGINDSDFTTIVGEKDRTFTASQGVSGTLVAWNGNTAIPFVGVKGKRYRLTIHEPSLAGYAGSGRLSLSIFNAKTSNWADRGTRFTTVNVNMSASGNGIDTAVYFNAEHNGLQHIIVGYSSNGISGTMTIYGGTDETANYTVERV